MSDPRDLPPHAPSSYQAAQNATSIPVQQAQALARRHALEEQQRSFQQGSPGPHLFRHPPKP